MPRGQNERSRKNLKPFKPGQSGNPAGRKTAGATIREHMNAMAEADLTETQLRTIARGKNEPWPRRAAAERILRTLEAGDLADFQTVIAGEKTLAELRDEGVNTELVKKVKPVEHGVEIELFDRAGGDVDRIMDRTEGKPKQTREIKHDVVLRTPDDRAAEATSAGDRLRQLLKPSRN